MKHTKALIILLCALALTGCGKKAEISAPAVDPVSEAVTEAETAAETETAAEAGTETNTSAASAAEATAEIIVEADTEPIGQLAPITNAEEIAYRYVKERVIPSCGLSDLAPFKSIDWENNGGTGVQPPDSTQGLISATVHDFENDGAPELLTVWSRDFSFYVDLYRIEADTCSLINSFKCCEYSEMSSVTPTILIQGNKVLVESYWMALPGMSRYGTLLSVYEVKDGNAEETLTIDSARYPGAEILSVNGEEYTTAEGEMDYAHADELLTQALQNAGVQYDAFSNGWGTEGMDILYGLNLIISDCMPVMSMEYANDDLDLYIDDTCLRERLSGM